MALWGWSHDSSCWPMPTKRLRPKQRSAQCCEVVLCRDQNCRYRVLQLVYGGVFHSASGACTEPSLTSFDFQVADDSGHSLLRQWYELAITRALCSHITVCCANWIGEVAAPDAMHLKFQPRLYAELCGHRASLEYESCPSFTVRKICKQIHLYLSSATRKESHAKSLRLCYLIHFWLDCRLNIA